MTKPPKKIKRIKAWAIVYTTNGKNEVVGFRHYLIFRYKKNATRAYKENGYEKIDMRVGMHSGWKVLPIAILLEE